MGFWKSVEKIARKAVTKVVVPIMSVAAGIAAAFSTSSYQPKVDLASPQQPVRIQFNQKRFFPNGAIPANAIPANAIPANAIPANAIPANTMPSEAIPANAIPANAIPANAIPANFKMMRTSPPPDFKVQVCGSGRCTETVTVKSMYSNETGIELAGALPPLDVKIWADSQYLTLGECTNVYWEVTGAAQVWFRGTLADASGVIQACPESSTSYAVDALGLDGARAGSLVYIEVASPNAEPDAASPPDRCALFDGMDISVVYLDWQPGAPLTFYFKMPGGVPGLDRQIPGDSGSWEYSAAIGDYSTDNCGYEGYKERLYCSVSLPSGYSNAVRSLTLSVNGCDSAIYSNQTAYLPGIEKAGGGGGSGGGDACGPQPDICADFSAWCAWSQCVNPDNPYACYVEYYCQ
ncbi:MAG: hypothetical protein GXP40_11855 [Chloroflexi bacterium]|nr:hypothetical protein [Chloroflexota bacterium]